MGEYWISYQLLSPDLCLCAFVPLSIINIVIVENWRGWWWKSNCPLSSITSPFSLLRMAESVRSSSVCFSVCSDISEWFHSLVGFSVVSLVAFVFGCLSYVLVEPICPFIWRPSPPHFSVAGANHVTAGTVPATLIHPANNNFPSHSQPPTRSFQQQQQQQQQQLQLQLQLQQPPRSQSLTFEKIIRDRYNEWAKGAGGW